LATARAGNVIGGGDWAEDRIVPDCVKALHAGQRIRLRSPNATRPWQHVLEPLAGYIALAQALRAGKERFAGAWNFGPRDDQVLNVESLVRGLVHAWGSGEYEIADDAVRHEANLLKLDISKARAELKWEPRLTVQQAIEWTVQWYRTHYRGEEDIAAFSRKQIEMYTKLSASKHQES